MAGAGFRARVLGYNPRVSAQEMREAGVEKYDDLREMLAECDFVSIGLTILDVLGRPVKGGKTTLSSRRATISPLFGVDPLHESDG